MTGAQPPRWLMSFADLTLLLLAFFVFLHARADGGAAAASVRAAFGGTAPAASPAERIGAARLFLADEAVLQPAAAYRLRSLGARLAAGGRRARIASEGEAVANSRLDAWELTAARSAAVARALGTGGLASDAIDIALPATSAQARKGPQVFAIESVS